MASLHDLPVSVRAVAIPKVCGIETEYGILVRGPVPDSTANPVSASSLLINAYLASVHRRAKFDLVDEHPGTDARGFQVDDLLAPEIETQLVNAVLTNGARYYVDHAHPEISTPECLTAMDAIHFDRAAERIIDNQRPADDEGEYRTQQGKQNRQRGQGKRPGAQVCREVTKCCCRLLCRHWPLAVTSRRPDSRPPAPSTRTGAAAAAALRRQFCFTARSGSGGNIACFSVPRSSDSAYCSCLSLSRSRGT